MSENTMKKQALLIGINQYQILPELKFARQDAVAVGVALKQNYNFSEQEVTLLTDTCTGYFKPINKHIIQKQLDALTQQDLDLFIFGFWGHGLYRNGMRYLCPLDVMNEAVEELGMSFGKLQELISNIRAKNTCLILDCCQSVHDRGEAELMTNSEQVLLGNVPRDIGLKRKENNPEFISNVAILNSCTKGQSAYEWDNKKHGIFTAHLLDAMNQKYDSVSKIISYLDEHVAKTALELGKNQKPFCKLEGYVEFPVKSPIREIVTGDVFISYRHANADIVAQVEEELKRQGITYFIDREDIDYGMSHAVVISQAMKACKVVLFFWTKEAGDSKDILKEVTMANNLDKKIVPYKIGTFDSSKHGGLSYELGPFSRYEVPVQTDATIKEVISCLQKALTGQISRSNFASSKSKSVPTSKNLTTITVPQDCQTLEEACEMIADNGTIYLEPGIYTISNTITLNRSITIRKKTSTSQKVEIRCNDNVFVIAGGSPQFMGLTIRSKGEITYGFRITSGTPIIQTCHIISDKCSGVCITGDESNPEFRSCRIYNCGIAGVFVSDNGEGEFNNCDIYKNDIGILVQKGGNPKVINCKIHNVKSVGVGVSDKGVGEFNNCDIYENVSWGIRVDTDGNPRITECKIHDGEEIGVVVSNNGRGEFRNCDIYKNKILGIGVELNGNPNVIGCKIHNGGVGIQIINKGKGEFNNCDIYKNAYGFLVQDNGNPTVFSCNVFDQVNDGISILNNSTGEFNDCNIYNNGTCGIRVCLGSNPKVTNSEIHDGKSEGVFVFGNGKGEFNNCDIYKNKLPGIEILTGGNPTVIGCAIHDGKKVGVFIADGGRGKFCNNILLNNRTENWGIVPTAGKVTGSGNKPALPSQKSAS